MRILDDIDDLSQFPPFRHRPDDQKDPLMAALRGGRPVKLTESDDLDVDQLRRLAKRLTDRARRRGLRQTRSTTHEAGKRVITVQWYRETLGDLIDAPVHVPRLRLLARETV